jgi:AraC-like DNA-binding protein
LGELRKQENPLKFIFAAGFVLLRVSINLILLAQRNNRIDPVSNFQYIQFMKSANNYARIEKVIKYLKENYQNQPSLDELARHVHLSKFHFQRLFESWAGVSPKVFIQFLTIEHAKKLLKSGQSTLNQNFVLEASQPRDSHHKMMYVKGGFNPDRLEKISARFFQSALRPIEPEGFPGISPMKPFRFRGRRILSKGQNPG